MLILFALVFSSINPLVLFPDLVNVTVVNSIPGSAITAVHCFVASDGRLISCFGDSVLPSGTSTQISLPARFITRIVFSTESGLNYRITDLVPYSSDTIVVSRSCREFGDYFDVILGSYPFLVRNDTPVIIAAVSIINRGVESTNILGKNPLLPEETLFLWHDSDFVEITAMDIEGNFSRPMILDGLNTNRKFSITAWDFIGIQSYPADSIVIVNGISGESVYGIDVLSSNGDFTFWDVSSSPLGLWRTIALPCSDEPLYIVCIDGQGREFTVDQPENSTKVYLVDWTSVDFDFRFPSGSGR